MARLLAFLAAVLLAGPAGATTADDVCPAAADPCNVTAPVTVLPGSTLQFGTRALVVKSGGRLVVTGGKMTVLAGSMRIEAGGSLIGLEGVFGAHIDVTTSGDIQIDGGGTPGRINVSADDASGEVDLTAGGNIVVAGELLGRAGTEFAGGGTVELRAGGTVVMSGTVALHGGEENIGGFFFVRAPGNVALGGSVDAAGGSGGSIDVSSTAGNVVVSASIALSGGGEFGDGGDMTIFARQNVTVSGPIEGNAAGGIDGGGAGATIDVTAETGAVTMSAPITIDGAPTDGSGGELDVTAGTDASLTGRILAQGIGIDACGGTVFVSAGGKLTLGVMQLAGGSCGGGSLFAEAGGEVSVPSEIDADGSIDEGGGFIEIAGGKMTVAGKLHASGLADGTSGGAITLEGCDVTVTATGQLVANGAGGSNLLRGSGQVVVAGKMLATPSGTNQIQFLALAPQTPGQIVPAPTIVQNAALPPCGPAGPVCGNGSIEGIEECDDGGTAACDGCSPVCRLEGCGNGRIECSEECDNGPANGAPGNPCDATCHAVAVAGRLLVPGAHSGPVGCLLEWSIENPNDPQTGGFPATTQTCIDGDVCDADGASDGACHYRVAACLASMDPRLPNCNPGPVAKVNLFQPNLAHADDAADVENSTNLGNALKALGITVLSGGDVLQTGTPNPTRDACTADVLVRVPHGPGSSGARQLSAGARDTARHRLRSNRVTLVCEPNPAVCGNGAVELGEQCDDGNSISCDGCSSVCRRDGCGDGVINCGEQCDAGQANGTPGSSCTDHCTEAPPALRIPGGGRAETDCLAEWSLATGQVLLDKKGRPAGKQDCFDGDPACDFDPTPGNCRLHLWVCFGGADDRLLCPTAQATVFEILRPGSGKGGAPGNARQRLLQGVAALGFPAGPGETCTGRMDIDVPAGRSRILFKTRVEGADFSEGDGVKLGCRVPR
jgi:cysteine-rich repeat protein